MLVTTGNKTFVYIQMYSSRFNTFELNVNGFRGTFVIWGIRYMLNVYKDIQYIC